MYDFGYQKKYRIWETLNLLTDADSINTAMKLLSNIYIYFKGDFIFYLFLFFYFFLVKIIFLGERGGGGREDQWEAWNWSYDLRANERPKKIHPLTQTDRQSDEHGTSMTESAQWGRFSENLTYARPWISRRLLIVALIPPKNNTIFFISCHVSGVSCHRSHVMCHISCVTCHVSPFMCHMSFVMCRS